MTGPVRPDSPFLDTARFVLNELSEYRFPITLRGMPYECWRCNERNLVPWLVHTRYWNVDGGKHQFDTEMITSEKALSYIQEFLQAAGDTQYLPTIKPRYSKTMRATYLSHGCRACDALFGDFPLGDTWFDEFVMQWGHEPVEVSLSKLPVIATLDRPYLEWAAMSMYYQDQALECEEAYDRDHEA
ncbi:hypothetical protein [Tsukamurella pseudospumae]|uniref:Uncharacterized protein n=1 Tax=Tsukamurella pseudospumae TaxID=239498 RepID=A0A138AE11_9ACTN|nr:hypothetical protein [Tsukamurella pseudospumae]KXP08738.1 hypothetical protein AXK60_08670 [Tsukamurella pseudospumae]